MSENTDRYMSPLSERYASREMQYIFSPDKAIVDRSGTGGKGAGT